MRFKHLVATGVVAGIIAACSVDDGFTKPELSPSVSQADVDAIADLLFDDLQASGVGDIGEKTFGAPPAVPVGAAPVSRRRLAHRRS